FDLVRVLRRPENTLADVLADLPELATLSAEAQHEIKLDVKYENYIDQQAKNVLRQKKLETTKLPENLNYQSIQKLRFEAREKLARVKPRSLGQAKRISKVNPTDLTVIVIHLKKLTQAH